MGFINNGQATILQQSTKYCTNTVALLPGSIATALATQKKVAHIENLAVDLGAFDMIVTLVRWCWLPNQHKFQLRVFSKTSNHESCS